MSFFLSWNSSTRKRKRRCITIFIWLITYCFSECIVFLVLWFTRVRLVYIIFSSLFSWSFLSSPLNPLYVCCCPCWHSSCPIIISVILFSIWTSLNFIHSHLYATDFSLKLKVRNSSYHFKCTFTQFVIYSIFFYCLCK